MDGLLCFSSLAVLLLFHGAEQAQSAKVLPHHPAITMRFYMHQTLLVPNASSLLVAGPENNITAVNPVGSIVAFDNPITQTSSNASKLVGRARGMYITDAFDEKSFLFTLTVEVFDGKYKGTISLHGQDPIEQLTREIAIIGGTRDFRLVQGYAELRTITAVIGRSATIQMNLEMYKPLPWTYRSF